MEYNLNLQELADNFGFELEEVELLLSTFLETAKENLIDIENAIKNNDKEALAHAAHSIKGSSSTLQLKEIFELAKEIELSAKNNKEIDYQAKYERLKELVDNITK